MRWLFRVIGLVLLGFVGLCIYGYFQPASQEVEIIRDIDADAYDLYEVISDLKTYPDWSGIGQNGEAWVFGGAASGQGQTAAWQDDTRFGTLEILQDTPGELVVINTVGPLGDQIVTLALNEQAQTTQFYMSAKRETGGFPYLGRIAAQRQKSATQDSLARAADGLAAQVE
jgi:hypothetical protein